MPLPCTCQYDESKPTSEACQRRSRTKGGVRTAVDEELDGVRRLVRVWCAEHTGELVGLRHGCKLRMCAVAGLQLAEDVMHHREVCYKPTKDMSVWSTSEVE
jgi:hypothetical protein